MQLAQCQNAMRHMPEAFKGAVSQGCDWNAVAADLSPSGRFSLVESPALVASAQTHVQDQAMHNIVDTTSWNGTTPARRIAQAVPSATRVAEMVAAGQQSVLEVLVDMMW